MTLNTATLGHNVEGCGAGWSPEQVIDACVERGFGGLTLWREEVAARPAEIGDRVRAAGLRVDGLCRSPFLVGPLASASSVRVTDEFRASIDMSGELGAGALTVVAGGVIENSHSISESLKRVTEILGDMSLYAEQCSVRLALEPLHPVYGGDRSCLVTVRDALDICNAIGSPALGLAIDVYHVWWDLSLASVLQCAGGDRIFGYHLCDWLPHTSDVLLDRGMMGDGVADLRGIRAAVEGAGYDGHCEVEVFSIENWWKREPGEVLDTIVERYRTLC